MASTYAGLAVELFNQMESSSMNPALAAVLSSSASIDTLGAKFPENIAERAAYQAAFIFELIKRNHCDNIFLVAHSLGGMEAHYIEPILAKLIKDSGLNINIKGLILFQPGGVVEQKVLTLDKLFRTLDFKNLIRGVREMWPSPDDFVDVEMRLDEAMQLGDPSEEFRLRMLRREMEIKRQSWMEMNEDEEKIDKPPYLISDERNILIAIDRALVGGELTLEIEDILKKEYKDKYPVLKRVIKTVWRERDLIKLARYHLLTPSLNRISGTDKEDYLTAEKNLLLREDISQTPQLFSRLQLKTGRMRH